MRTPVPASSRAGGGGRRGPEAGDLALDVERPYDTATLVLAPCLARHGPHDLELVAVGVAAVERLRNAVVAGAGERSGRRQLGGRGGQRLDRADLPGQVVEAGRAARRAGRGRADREETEGGGGVRGRRAPGG